MFTMTASNVYGANQIKGAEEEAAELGYKLRFSRTTSRSRSRTSRSSNTSRAAPSRRRSSSGRGSPTPRSTTCDSSRRSRPVIQLTQEPNEQSWPYVKAYSGANQILIGETLGEMLLKARDAAKAAGMKFKSHERQSARLPASRGREDRHRADEGVHEGHRERPFNVIHTEYGANSPETGYEIGSQVIPKYKGQFDFLFVSNQQAANGIIRALKENGITPGKDVYIVSGDCSGSLDAVKNGETFGTGIQPAAVEGALAVAHRRASTSPPARSRAMCIQFEVTRRRAARSTTTPPAKYNYMPHAAGNRRRRAWRTRRSGATRPTRSAPAERSRIEHGARNGYAFGRHRSARPTRPRLSVRGLVEALRQRAGAGRGRLRAAAGRSDGAARRERRRQDHSGQGAVRPGSPRCGRRSRSMARRPSSIPSARSQAAGVAVVHQEYSSVPTMTVAENLVLGQTGVSRRSGCPAGSRRAPASCWLRSGSITSTRGRLGRQPERRRDAAARDRAAARARCADPDLRRADRGARRSRDRTRAVGHQAPRRRRPQRDLRHPPAAGGISHHRPRDRVPQRPQPAAASRPCELDVDARDQR